jgi:hypothetical protein
MEQILNKGNFNIFEGNFNPDQEKIRIFEFLKVEALVSRVVFEF